MEQIALPDVLADGCNQLDLPDVLADGCNQSEALPDEWIELDRQQALPGECQEFEVPDAPRKFSCKKRRTCQEHKIKFCDLPYLRTSALLDLPTIAMKFGADLMSVPTSWLDEANARQLIAASGIAIVLPLFLLLNLCRLRSSKPGN